MIGINRRHVAAGPIAIASLASAGVAQAAQAAQAAQGPAARPASVTRPAASPVNVKTTVPMLTIRFDRMDQVGQGLTGSGAL